MLSLIFNRDKFIAAINFSQTAIFFRETKTTFFARLFDNVGITDIRDGLHISNDFSLLDHFRRVGRSIKRAVHILFTISPAHARPHARTRARANSRKGFRFCRIFPRVYIVITRRGIMY